MTTFLGVVVVGLLSLVNFVVPQDDLIRMMMLSQLLSGGGFGGGGQQQAAMPAHNTGFEGDPRSMQGSAPMSSSSPGGLFGGLMGLLSRNAGSAAPLLLDVDGDILRQQLWQRGLLNPGSGALGTGGGAAVPSSPSGPSLREAGSPLTNGPVPGSQGAVAPSGRPKSMPHIALPFDVEFTGSASNPAPVESVAAGEGLASGTGPQPAGFQSPP